MPPEFEWDNYSLLRRHVKIGPAGFQIAINQSRIALAIVSHMVVFLWHMARASDIERAERLNHARGLLQRFDHLPDAVERMVRDCSVSHRQAYRYLHHARRLKRAVPVGDTKIPFTVKLSKRLVKRLRSYASRTGSSLSGIVSLALETVLARRKKRG